MGNAAERLNTGHGLVGAWLPARLAPRLLVMLALVAVGTAALALAGKVKVPFYPVPMTLQTFVLAVIALTCGWRLSVVIVVTFLAQGAMGLPVFTNTPPLVASPAYFFGPTGGFLLGFIVCAAVTGRLAEGALGQSMLGRLAAVLAGFACVFGLGVLWLAYGAELAFGATSLGLQRAVAAGALPFLLGDLVKAALAAAVVSALAPGRRA